MSICKACGRKRNFLDFVMLGGDLCGVCDHEEWKLDREIEGKNKGELYNLIGKRVKDE